MTDLAKRLLDGAKWVEANARYHFNEHQKHDPLRQSLQAAEAMKEAAATLATPPEPIAEPQPLPLPGLLERYEELSDDNIALKHEIDRLLGLLEDAGLDAFGDTPA